MFKSFKRIQHGRVSVNELPAVVGGHNIAAYIELEQISKLGKYYKYGNRIKTGYDAEAIIILCVAYLSAEKDNAIKPQ